MMRALAVLGVLLSLTAASASAEYLIIRAEFPRSQGPARVAALVEVTKHFTINQINAVNTRLSKNTQLFAEEKSVQVIRDGQGKDLPVLPTVTNEYESRKDALKQKQGPVPTYQTAEWVLGRALSVTFAPPAGSMMREFKALMGQLAKNGANAPPHVRDALNAYQEIQGLFARPLQRDLIAESWANRLGLQAQDVGQHFTILHRRGNPPAGMAGRVNTLEQVFEGFYDWFALKGQVLPLPPRRIVIVIIDSPADFRRHHDSFDAPPLVADAFLARGEQVAFYASEPLADGYQTLKDANQAIFLQNGWNQNQLLQGQPQKPNPLVPRAQTLALLQRALEDESELVASTQVGVEQLIAASGLLPRTVPAPQWLQFGLPSFFAASRGALWAGFGGPHWEYLFEFKRMSTAGQFEAPAVLRRLLSDGYFREAAADRNSATLRQARTLAWSLTYFLANNHLPELLRFYRELGNLPREMELDEGEVLGCFARAFGLESPGRPGQIDDEKLARLAREWQRYVGQLTALPLPEGDLVLLRQALNP